MRKLTYEMTSQGLRPIVKRFTNVEMAVGASNNLTTIKADFDSNLWDAMKKRGYVKVA
ncbi:hypothetical protein P4261_28220 [Bacillus thuringiensis]|nr:hypothetical protein [Bacillus thuringiensis]MED2856371.1 hypothetical protein [Bacillus thuringiensis]MED2863825.1 hypothetical protein [Bacillus thuringiensis]